MKTVTKNNVRMVARKYGATLTETEYLPYDQSYEFTIDAPNGYWWTDTAVGLRVIWWGYDKASKQDAFKDVINRMEQTGISEYKE